MEKLTAKEYRLLEIALTNLLELYAELGTPRGTEKAVLQFEKLKNKLVLINQKSI